MDLFFLLGWLGFSKTPIQAGGQNTLTSLPHPTPGSAQLLHLLELANQREKISRELITIWSLAPPKTWKDQDDACERALRGALLVFDHNLPEEPPGLIIAKGLHRILEREHPIDDGFQSIDLDCSVHGDELGSTSHRYELQGSKRAS
jgi:hypothetical protein